MFTDSIQFGDLELTGSGPTSFAVKLTTAAVALLGTTWEEQRTAALAIDSAGDAIINRRRSHRWRSAKQNGQVDLDAPRIGTCVAKHLRNRVRRTQIVHRGDRTSAPPQQLSSRARARSLLCCCA